RANVLIALRSCDLWLLLRKNFLQNRDYYYSSPFFVYVAIRRAHASLGSARTSRASDDALVIADFPTLATWSRRVQSSFRRGRRNPHARAPALPERRSRLFHSAAISQES